MGDPWHRISNYFFENSNKTIPNLTPIMLTNNNNIFNWRFLYGRAGFLSIGPLYLICWGWALSLSNGKNSKRNFCWRTLGLLWPGQKKFSLTKKLKLLQNNKGFPRKNNFLKCDRTMPLKVSKPQPQVGGSTAEAIGTFVKARPIRIDRTCSKAISKIKSQSPQWGLHQNTKRITLRD